MSIQEIWGLPTSRQERSKKTRIAEYVLSKCIKTRAKKSTLVPIVLRKTVRNVSVTQNAQNSKLLLQPSMFISSDAVHAYTDSLFTILKKSLMIQETSTFFPELSKYIRVKQASKVTHAATYHSNSTRVLQSLASSALYAHSTRGNRQENPLSSSSTTTATSSRGGGFRAPPKTQGLSNAKYGIDNHSIL